MTSMLAGLIIAPGCVRKQFFQPDARLAASAALPTAADSVRGATAGRQYARHGSLYAAFVGRHHRPTWAAPVSAPVLELATVRAGGLRPGKVGGGFNSTSLGLTGPDGRAYVLRTVDKDPIRATPEWLRGTFLVNALRDNISAANPYAGLVVPPLAEAAGVPHANPRLFYVRADDPAFQTDSLRHFPGQLAYLEEKAAPMPPDAPAPIAVVNSTKAFAAVYNGTAQIDQPALLRARLLDAWLGDWDRHEGQWSWAVRSPAPAGVSPLAPLPKDRDMVFYRLDDGVLGWLVGHLALRHWVTFGPRFAHVSQLFASGHYLDVRGLNALTRPQFRAAAAAMQQHLPDTLIARAMHRLPAAAFALEGPRTVAALQQRREALPALADKLYLELARRPVVGGSAQAERFEIHRYADSTVVAVYPISSAAAQQPALYRRAFIAAETQTIQVEGLGGDDTLLVTEHAPKTTGKPKVVFYGGSGHDELRGQTKSRGIRFEQAAAPAKHAYNHSPKE
jgi:hypothetical protein